MNNTTKSWYKRWWGITIIVISTLLLSIIVAIAIYVANFINSDAFKTYQYRNPDYENEIKNLIEGQDYYWLGNKNAEIVIVEFADYACPYCKESFFKIRELSSTYADNIKYIYRDFPVLQDYSVNLSLASRCAGDQGLFWVMHDKLFLNQGISTKEEIMDLANQIGVNHERFEACFENNKYLPQIEKDFSDAQKLGLTGTPTWFINGQLIKGNIPYNILKDIIEGLIKN